MSRQREFRWLAGLLAVGLAARLAFVAFVDTKPSFSGGDGGFYLTVAQNLANGYGFVFGQLATYRTEPVLTAGPLYPAYLAVFYMLLGGYETHPIMTRRPNSRAARPGFSERGWGRHSWAR